MKIGAMVVAYNDDDFLEPVLRALEPLDRVMVSVGAKPWRGPSWPADRTLEIAREFYTRDDSKYIYELVDYATEHEQRNNALDVLHGLGCDLVMVVDADELWPLGDLLDFLSLVREQRGAASAWCARAHQLWKSPEWRIEPDDHWFCACVDPRLARFSSLRNVDRGPVVRAERRRSDGSLEPPPRFHHFSYVRKGEDGGDERIRRKVESFSHSHEVAPDWHERVWRGWTPAMRDLNPTDPPAYARAVPYRLPPEVASQIGWKGGRWT